MPTPLHATTSTPQPFPEPKCSITLLPTELLDLIFSALIEPSSADSDTNVYLKDVRGCALICRRLGAVCRKYIFRDISVKATDRARIFAFGELVNSRESIKKDVRILRYDADPDTPPPSREPPLTLVLDLLSHQRLHTFHFTGNEFWKLHLPLLDAVTALIISNPIVSLGLHDMTDMPERYLSPEPAHSPTPGWLQPTLKALILDYADVDGVCWESPTGGGAPRARLERFEVRNCYLELLEGHLTAPGYEFPSRRSAADRDGCGDDGDNNAALEQARLVPIDFTQLKYFRISDDDVRDDRSDKSNAAVNLIGFILETTQCLEYLSLEESNYDEALFYTSKVLSSSISPSSFRSLKHLEVILNVSEPDDDPYFSFTDELTNLARLSEREFNGTPLGLQTLTIKVIISDEVELPEAAEWSQLDTALMDDGNLAAKGACSHLKAAFRNLRNVDLTVEVRYVDALAEDEEGRAEILDNLSSIGKVAFPRLQASPTVKFSYTSDLRLMTRYERCVAWYSDMNLGQMSV